jgi:hypothetical protein
MEGALKPLVATQFLTNAAATYYTVPQALANSIAIPEMFVFANTDSSAHTITMHNVVSGGSAASSNKIFATVSIPANTTWIGRYPGGAFVMGAGGTLQALADANSVVTLTVGGREFQ